MVEHRPDPSQGEYPDPEQGAIGFLEAQRVSTDNWRIHAEEIPGQEYPDGPLSLRHAQRRAVDGPAIERLHLMGIGIPDQKQARY